MGGARAGGGEEEVRGRERGYRWQSYKRMKGSIRTGRNFPVHKVNGTDWSPLLRAVSTFVFVLHMARTSNTTRCRGRCRALLNSRQQKKGGQRD